MLRIITDTFITAYALAVIRGNLGTVPHATVMTIVLAFVCAKLLRDSWKTQGLWH